MLCTKKCDIILAEVVDFFKRSKCDLFPPSPPPPSPHALCAKHFHSAQNIFFTPCKHFHFPLPSPLPSPPRPARSVMHTAGRVGARVWMGGAENVFTVLEQFKKKTLGKCVCAGF